MDTFLHGPSFFSFHFLSFSISFPKLTIFTILRLYMACKMWKIIFSAMRMSKRQPFCASSQHDVPYEKQQELNQGSEPWKECPC